MIWQLIKRSPTFRMTPWVMLACAAFPRGRWTLSVFLGLLIVTWNVPEFRSRTNLYKASLPVEGRDLWLAQIVSLLTLLWLSALAASAAIFLAGESPSLFLQGASLWTVFVLAVQRYRIQEFAAPKWVWVGSILAFAVIATPFPLLMRDYTPPPARIIFAISGALSAALFLSCLLAVPKSFQIAPARPVASPPRREPAPSRLLWSPVLRCIYDWQTAVWLCFVVIEFALGASTLAFMFASIFFLMPREPGRWLISLPVAPRTIFRLKAAPAVAGLCAASIAQIFLDPVPRAPRARIAELALALMLVFLLCFFSELLQWWRLSRLPMWARVAPLLASLLAVLAAKKPAAAFDTTAAQIVSALPANHVLFALALLAPLAFLYWLAERTFGELECSSWRAVRQA